MTDSQTPGPIASFAQQRGLAFAASSSLPRQGSTLDHDNGKVEGAASGKLPGGIEGTLAHYTYSYTVSDADDHTHTVHRKLTLVVTAVPESIGFAPNLGFAGSGSDLSATAGALGEVRKIDLGDDDGLQGASACVYKGSSESWVAQLFSPAMIDWLARSEDDFGFELANGVLCAGRDGYLADATALQRLCEDAAHVATAIREESLEETASGGAETDAAKDPDSADPRMEEALGKVETGSPADVTSATDAFRGYARRSPATFFAALRTGALITLVLNIPAAAIPILMVVNKLYLPLLALELVLIVLITFFAFRSRVGSAGKKYALEAFFRAYAAERELKLEEPLKFAATHAEAGLPFKPERVFSGVLAGGANASLALSGDGSKRSDKIAIVAGPHGPVFEAELKTSPPGLSAKTLDEYTKVLVAELAPKAKA